MPRRDLKSKEVMIIRLFGIRALKNQFNQHFPNVTEHIVTSIPYSDLVADVAKKQLSFGYVVTTVTKCGMLVSIIL